MHQLQAMVHMEEEACKVVDLLQAVTVTMVFVRQFNGMMGQSTRMDIRGRLLVPHLTALTHLQQKVTASVQQQISWVCMDYLHPGWV
jgi:hypothetical protein